MSCLTLRLQKIENRLNKLGTMKPDESVVKAVMPAFQVADAITSFGVLFVIFLLWVLGAW